MAHRRNLTLPGNINNRSSIFFNASHDKRNMLWRAFRKTVLEPHAIHVLENAVMEKVPEMLLELVDEMCQNLERHEQQAISFQEAVEQGRGFGPSPIFPPDVVPPVNFTVGLSRCMEPSFDKTTLPPQEISLHMPLFDLPIPRPGLACGFSQKAFSEKESQTLPKWLSVIGTYSDYGTGQIQPGQAVHVPFLMFERTYGHARHEIEAAMNYCAMDGAAALHSLLLLYDKAWEKDDWNRPASPVVFTCTIDDCLAIIHFHWIEDQKTFMAAPLCKFDLRDTEHFMHFLAWTESIEQWASYFLLPDVKEALGILNGSDTVKQLSSPVTIEQKNEKVKQSMKMAFENIPWKNEKIQGAPLAVTATMRVNSPPPKDDIVIYESSVESAMIDMRMSEVPAHPSSAYTVSDHRPPSLAPSARSAGAIPTDSFRYTQLPSPYTAGMTLEMARKQDPKRVNIEMPPPPRPEERLEEVARSVTPAMSSPAFSTSEMSETSTKYSTTQSTYSTSTNHTRSHTLTDVDPSLPVSLATHAMPPQLPAPLSLQGSMSKRSLPSLKSKRIRSPATPEMLGKSPSPRGNGFRSKLSSSLGMIKEHARPKRIRMDNSGPPTPNPGDALPTPAYDKRRFEAPDTDSNPNETSAWVEHVLQDRIVVNDTIFGQPTPMPPSSNGAVNPPARIKTTSPAPRGYAISPPLRGEAISPPLRSQAISPPPRKQTPLIGVATVSSPPRNKTPLYAAAEPPPRHQTPANIPSRNQTPVNAAISPPPRGKTVSPPPRNTTPLYAAAEPPPRHRTPINGPPRGQTPMNAAIIPPVRGKSPYNPIIPPSRGHTPVHALSLMTKVQPVLNQIPSAGSANYLPLRDYTGGPEPLKAQTITTGPA